MRRIDLLTFGSLILNDDHLALPVTVFAQNTWETGIARTINTAIFMTQLLESRKNNTDLLQLQIYCGRRKNLFGYFTKNFGN